MFSYRILAGAAGLFGGLIAVANAQSLTGSSPGFHYFHKPGANMAEHDAALVSCAVATRAMVNGSDAMTGIAASTGGGLLPALIGGIIDNNENRQGDAANAENCMALRGWSVVGLTNEEGESIEEPDEPATIHAKLVPLVEAIEPAGPILRGPFANELFDGDFQIGQALDLEEVSLSVRAVRDLTEAAIEAAGELKPPKPPKLPRGIRAPKPAKAIKASALAGADPALSFLVMRVSAEKNSAIVLFDVTFNRLAADGSEVVYDGDVVTARTSLAKTAKGEKDGVKYADYVIEVPPGMWKLGTLSSVAFATDLCFGAPAFEVKAGETVVIGEIRLRDTGGYPLTQNLALAGEILAANPRLAENAKLAEFTNGFLSDCFGSYAYAYEIPGAPFIDMPSLAREAARKAAEAAA